MPHALTHQHSGLVASLDLSSSPALATKDYRGNGTLNSGRGTLSGGANPSNLEVAFDDTNTAGITASSVKPAATATTGIAKRHPIMTSRPRRTTRRRVQLFRSRISDASSARASSATRSSTRRAR